MLHQNFAHYLGQPIDTVLQQLKEEFFGRVVVYSPGQVSDASVKPTRLKVFVDDQRIISKIVNG